MRVRCRARERGWRDTNEGFYGSTDLQYQRRTTFRYNNKLVLILAHEYTQGWMVTARTLRT